MILKKTGIGISLLMLVLSLSLTFDVQPAKASGTIYIRPDGSIDPPIAPIQRNGNLYTLTDNITSDADGIAVEADNIVVDGENHTIQGTQTYNSRGISLSGRSNVTIKDMTVRAFCYGIYLNSSINNIVRENDIANNGWYDRGYGIYLISSSNNTILKNDLTHDRVNGTAYGIALDHSPYNTIRENTITDCVWGILLSSSSSNILASNAISSSIPVNDTTYSMPFYFSVLGSSLSEYMNDVDSSNTVGGKPIYYLVNRRDMTVPSDAGCVVLVNCTGILVQNLNLTGNRPSICLAYTTNCTITRNEVSMATVGIMLYSSSNNVISKNKVSSHWGNSWIGGICLISSDNNVIFGNEIKETMNYTIWYSNGGMWLDSSSHNKIYENIITTYHRGIFLNSSANNMIYHNNFINSTQQAYSLNSVTIWDDGYPSGGNYWTSYNGSDTYSGIYQNETGSDGIGDTPYVIDANNRDNYPLIVPWVVAEDSIPPVVANVRHEPLYPMEDEMIYFYADVTDNVGVASVQLNYTLDGGATWLLKDMSLFEGDTYSTSLGPYLQFQILGFYVIAYDTSGNWNWGSEIVPPLPEPPKVAPIVVSDQPPTPLPDGKDVGYNVTGTGIDIIANVSELGIGGNGVTYSIVYSIDGGLTWIQGGMSYIGDFVWTYVIPSFTNILFKVVGSDGSSSRVYWIIIGPWKYPIYLYFSTDEKYYPVPGLDFDYAKTSNYDVSNNKDSYDKYFAAYRPGDLDGDGVPDIPAYAYMNPKSLDDGCLVIEYWIYYAFNDYAVVDKHEHDFESVYLWIDIATGHIKKLACSQHTWVNHYLFDIQDPPSRINLAVEEGGHGMALLEDKDGNGLPDLNILGSYNFARARDYDIPWFWADWTINPKSFVAQLFPWVIYDPRLPSSELHLFSDPSVLTTGLSLSAIIPLLPNIVDDVPTYYNGLGALLSSATLLKTSYGFTLPVLADTKLVFGVTAPLFREEFGDAAKFWNKVSYAWWVAKQVVRTVITFILMPEVLAYFEVAVTLRLVITAAAGAVTSKVLGVYFDPVQGAILDFQGHVLNCTSAFTDLPGSIILATSNMTSSLYDMLLVMTNSSNDYIYEVKGIQAVADYNFTAFLVDTGGNELFFNATKIPIHVGEIHRFIINWTMLENQQLGVDVYVDQNGEGNFEHEFSSGVNLTGDEFLLATVTPTIQSCSSNGVPKDIFAPTESLYVRGSGYIPSTTYDIYLVNATTWTDGMLIPLRIAGTDTAITSDSLGNVSVTLAWPAPLPGRYDIVVDVNGDGHYNATIDALDKSYILGASGLFVVPEYWFGTILWIAACITAFGAYRKRRQLRLYE